MRFFFAILYWISSISKKRWIQLESVKHDWWLLKLLMVMNPVCESADGEFKYKNFWIFVNKILV